METDTVLVNFLKKLASEIENKTILEKDLQKVGEFYISFLYEKTDKVDSDFYKFLTMGWYVYNNIK